MLNFSAFFVCISSNFRAKRNSAIKLFLVITKNVVKSEFQNKSFKTVVAHLIHFVYIVSISQLTICL